MPRALLLAVAVPLVAYAPAAAAPPPTVRVTAAHCTTEPAPTTPIVRHRATRTGLRVTVVGPGRLCASAWTVTTAGREVVLAPDASVDAPGCPSTCAVELSIRGLPRGRWSVRVR